jgi:Ca2+-binding RTX toxin-like protein
MNNNNLHQASLLATTALSDFASESCFWQNFEVAFGKNYDQAKATEIRQAAIDRTFILPIRVIDDLAMGSAIGAFSIQTDTIYLRDSLVNSGDLESIGAVIIEELGHAIDSRVNQVEAPGDEGAIFRLLVGGNIIPADFLAELYAEDDWGTIVVDGQELAVEMADIPTNVADKLIGTIGSDLIDALGGDDSINALLGNDTVDGGTGNDLLIVDYSSYAKNEYTGTTRPGFSSSLVSNGIGGFNGNFLYNTPTSSSQVSFSNIERFYIVTGGDNDNITTGDGDDTINAGSGDNIIVAGGGNDNIKTLTGIPSNISSYYIPVDNDNISAGDGNDTIDAGYGIDTIDGGDGIDTSNGFFLLSDTDLTFNDSGETHEPITLKNGAKVSNIEYFTNLVLGSGNDFINFKKRINNSIQTSGGDDTINAGLGQDYVDGGRRVLEGNDLLIVDYSGNTYGGLRMSVGRERVPDSYSGYIYAFYDSNGNYDRVDFSGIERLQITGTAVSDTIYGSGGNDTLNGGGGDDYISINSGGLDVIDGGSGIDTIDDANFAAATVDLTINDIGTTILVNGTSISNIEKFNFLATGSGNDFINFTKQASRAISTGGGNDTIKAGLGEVFVSGDAGDDLLIVDYSSNSYTVSGITSFIGSNAPGNNSYFSVFNSDTSSSDKVSFLGVERFQVTGTVANDSILTGSGNDTLNGGNGDDYFNGGLGNDSVAGGNGNDVFDGAGDSFGLDTFVGGSGDDVYRVYNSGTVIVEDATALGGNDTVWAAVNYALAANIENLYLVGDVNGTGNSSNNNIVGDGIGNNTINGGAGADSLTGGFGTDIFSFQFGESSNLAADKILDFAIGTDRIDIFALGGLAAPAPTSFSRAKNNSSAITLKALAQAVYRDANGAINGTQSLILGGAAVVVSTNAAIAGTYLIVDDRVAGFSRNDLVVNITGYSGNLPALGAISVPSFFI